MTSNEEYDEAYALLVELSERYGELPLPAHIGVMEAFNAVADSELGPPTDLPAAASTDPREIMRQIQELLRRLQLAAPSLGEALLFSRAHTFVTDARAELR